MSAVETMPLATVRRLHLAGQGLLAPPARRATTAAVRAVIDDLAFVQVDTINIVARAHDQILGTRLDGYRPAALRRLLERDRACFEHWTHDASILPIAAYPYWKHRFRAYRARGHSPTGWWAERMGPRPDRVIRRVRDRIRAEGPLMSRDFQVPAGGSEPWWGWSPAKAALEYLWRCGVLAIAGRRHFHKVYDLAPRVHPEATAARMPSRARLVDFACRAALERLGAATDAELWQFLRVIDRGESRSWCARAAQRGAIVPVRMETAGGKPVKAWAPADWRRRAEALPAAPDRMRLLSPFDPLVRDRRRLERLFGFDYRFEAFVPEPKRRHGYYVMPVLDGERLVARVDPKLDRAAGVLHIRGVWWENGVRATQGNTARLREAAERLAVQCGGREVRMEG